jgi:hypothetical protein
VAPIHFAQDARLHEQVERDILAQGILVVVVVAPNRKHLRVAKHARNLRDEPKLSLARAVEHVAEQARKQLLLAGISEAPFQLRKDLLRVFVGPSARRSAAQVGVADKEKANVFLSHAAPPGGVRRSTGRRKADTAGCS